MSPVTCHPQAGVALIITLIMLAVITFMAVTFLALSRREAGAVRVSSDAITAANASYSGVERSKAEIMAAIMATKNIHSFGLLVSTNYINWLGYNNAQPHDQLNWLTLYWATNVNYAYPNGNPLTGDDARQNLANLLYASRPPVFVTNRLFANSNEFRFYLDLNRNRRYDTNGYWPVISADPTLPYVHTNGTLMATPQEGVTLSNYFVGDPEWHGVLARPEFPHSATNQFVARYAFIVVPTGKTLDVNYVHNQAKQPAPNAEGFFRNQGIGPWEINLAAFLADLNTNLWLLPPSLGGYALNMPAPYYRYSTSLNPPTVGAAFDDAWSLVYYRYANNYKNSLLNLQGEFGPSASPALGVNYVDDYSGGPLMTNYWGWNVTLDPDTTPPRSTQWRYFGSENPNRYFTTQDLFDKTKIPPQTGFDFVERLEIAGTNVSSYDRYTYYRLLEQLGTDSAPEPPGKIHLNYVNLGPFRATNFVSWDDPQVAATFGRPGSEVFFATTADKLLRQYTGEWWNASSNLFWASFGLTNSFGVTNIPVWVSNRFVYTPSVHRLLQVAANVYDSMTNHAHFNDAGATNLPTVFRPQFERRGNDIYIAGFVEVHSFFDIQSRPLKSLVDTNVAANIQRDDLIFGVPLVIGAKKGLPNFNEFAMQAIFQATRKLEIRRPNLAAPKSSWRTNMMFVVGLSNVFGAEAWNSFRANYTRPVDIYVTNYLDMTLTMTNEGTGASMRMNLNPVIGRRHSIPNPTNAAWFGYNKLYPNSSFAVPLKTNVVFLPDAAFVPGVGFTTNWAIAWDTSQNFHTPQLGLAVTNRLQFIVVDRNSGRLIDYVLLEGLNDHRNLSEEIRDPDNVIGFDGMWSTNRNPLTGNLPQGILNQIDVSLGNHEGTSGADWNGYGLGQPTGTTKDYEINYFRALYNLSTGKYPGLVNTNLVQQVPFTPTKRVSRDLTWQANDPLVHYTAGDLANLATAQSIVKHSLKSPVEAVKNIGQLNDRYSPWGGKPDLTGGAVSASDTTPYNLAIKDPGVRQSDDWQFPTNKFPNIGWLGRVHRGTPWQTIYMKSFDVLRDRVNGLNVWTNWTGNNLGHLIGTNIIYDAERSVPESDRLLFDVFTTALNENATRGQLPVNQTNLAAWSALFAGVAVLSNSAASQFPTNLTHQIIEPAGIYDPTDSNRWPAMVKLVQGINHTRADTNRFPVGSFRNLGDILAVPELSTNSPFLNLTNDTQLKNGLNDAVYEWLPQQVMGLLRTGEPRFVVYSYGQTLRPARNSIYLGSGPFNGMCTNYQVTAEVATRTVLRVEGSPDPAHANHPDPARRYPPRIVVENFNLLPPD